MIESYPIIVLGGVEKKDEEILEKIRNIAGVERAWYFYNPDKSWQIMIELAGDNFNLTSETIIRELRPLLTNLKTFLPMRKGN